MTIAHYNRKIELLEADRTLTKREMQAYRQENRLNRRETQQVHKELNFLRDEVRQLSEVVRRADEARLKLFQANLLIRVVEKVAKANRSTSESSEGLTGHSKIKFLRQAENMRKDTFLNITGLPEKCFSILKNLETVRSPSKSIRGVIDDEFLVYFGTKYHCPRDRSDDGSTVVESISRS